MPLPRKTYLQPDGSIADLPINESRLKIRVKARVDTILDSSGHYARRKPKEAPHWQEFTIAKSQLPGIQSLVETDEQSLAFAREHYRQRYDAWIEANGGEESEQYNESTFGGSVERYFYEHRRRGVLPLVAVEVLEDGIAPPLMPMQVGVSARDMGQDNAAILAELKALRERSDKQDKTIAALRNRLGDAHPAKRSK